MMPESKLGVEHQYYIQIVTSNRQRAVALQQALPGGKSVYFAFSPVNEDLAKRYGSEEKISIYDALQQAKRIAEYKGQRDFDTIGGARGAIAQLSHIGKPREDAQPFPYLARLTSDSIQLAFDHSDVVHILHKPFGAELFRLPDQLSGRRTAIVTALTRIVAPLEKSLATSQEELVAYMSTVLVMTQYTLRKFTRGQYKSFVADTQKGGGGPREIRKVAGGLPFTRNPFINTDEPYEIIVINPQTGGEFPLDRGTNWDTLNRSQCVHGAFPEAIESLFDQPGIPLPRAGIIYH